jgi:acyl-CoA thioester hydrolase
MEGFSFATPLRVRFAETDAQGVAHNSSYFVWFEVGRVEYLREFAGGYQSLRDEGIEALVLETHLRYLQAARFDDELLVRVRCTGVSGARFRFEYAIERNGTTIADGWTAHACVDATTLRPTRVPAALAHAIRAAESSRPEPSSSGSASSVPASSAPASSA